jgi:hypothetical protein
MATFQGCSHHLDTPYAFEAIIYSTISLFDKDLDTGDSQNGRGDDEKKA